MRVREEQRLSAALIIDLRGESVDLCELRPPLSELIPWYVVHENTWVIVTSIDNIGHFRLVRGPGQMLRITLGTAFSFPAAF